jgi:DNA-directed RNA polymerase specialized sigma24 family protein
MKIATVDASLTSVQDEALIEMTLAGHNACFEALMGRHLDAVRKRVDAIVRNNAEAEDVLQEVQLKTWQHLWKQLWRPSVMPTETTRGSCPDGLGL